MDNDPLHAATRHQAPVWASPQGDQGASVRDRLFRLAYRFLWNRADAEDAVQEAMLAAFSKSQQLREGDKWWGWLCRIVVRQCHVLGRRKSLRRRHEASRASAVSTSDTAGVALDATELKELLRESLVALPRRQREVLVLRHLEDMPFERIAEVLSMAPATARVHAQQGRERLLEIVLRRHPEWKEVDER